jgi:FG-GAP repeat
MFAILAVAVVAVGGSLVQTSGHGRPALGTAAHTQAHLSTAATLAVSRGLGADLPGYRLTRSSDGFLARNARQGLTASFGDHGATVSTRDGAHASIALQAIGSGTALRAVGLGQPLARGNRIEYRRGGATEWFSNGPAGIEQGFTIAAKPAGATNGTLTLTLGLSGTLAALPGTGGGLVLNGAGGKAVLHYGDLSVTDARGKALPAHMTAEHGRVLISVDSRGARYPLTVDPLMSVAELYASPGTEEEELGYSAVAVSGKTVVAGAPSATVGGHKSAGAAYVFMEGTNGWASSPQAAELLPSASQENALFGHSVAISGKTIVIEAPDASDTETYSGAAYVFSEPTGGWSSSPLQHQATELGDTVNEVYPEFGKSVAISGETIVVGSPLYVNYIYQPKTFREHPEDGAAFIFVQPAGGWTAKAQQYQSFTLQETEAEYAEYEEDDYFGVSVAIGESNGEQTVVVAAPSAKVNGHYDQGAAFIFNRPTGGWTTPDPIKLESSPGATLTNSNGVAYEKLGEASGKLGVSAQGETVAISHNEIVIGAPEAKDGANEYEGAAYVFAKPTGGWEVEPTQNQAAKLLPADGKADSEFGKSVAAEDPTVMVGGAGNGYVFSMPAGGWSGEPHQSSELEGYVSSVSLTPGYGMVGEFGRKPPKETGHLNQGDVEVIPLGPIVTTGASSGLSSSSVTIEGSVAPNRNAVSTCVFQYGTGTSYGAEAPCAQTVAGTGNNPTTVTAALTGLSSGTTYHYRVVASNADGTSYGQDGTFTTATTTSTGGGSESPSPVAGPSSTTSTTTAATSTPSSGTSVSAATSPKAIEELLNGCSSSALVLNDVYIQGSHVFLSGSAAKSLVGKKVKILFNEGKQVATATVKANGQYTTTAPLPPAKIRDSLTTRYTAEVGKVRSLHLKLVRRLLLEPPKASGTTVTLTGQLTLPLTKPIAPVTVEQQLECGKTTVAKTFTPPASGRFHITITVPANAKAAIFRLTSKVAANKHSVKHGFTTFSLPLPVAIG